jgi:hypothetical protein
VQARAGYSATVRGHNKRVFYLRFITGFAGHATRERSSAVLTHVAMALVLQQNTYSKLIAILSIGLVKSAAV